MKSILERIGCVPCTPPIPYPFLWKDSDGHVYFRRETEWQKSYGLQPTRKHYSDMLLVGTAKPIGTISNMKVTNEIAWDHRLLAGEVVHLQN